MDKELLKKAKKLVKDKYGVTFAKKATDEFCLQAAGAYLKPNSESFGFENFNVAMSETIQQPSVIMEFKAEPVQKDTSQPGDHSITKRVNDFLETLKEDESIIVNLQQAWKQERMKTFREKTMKDMHPLKASLEKNIERAFAHRTRSLQQESYLTRVCWLNQTVQTIADPVSIAEIAQDPLITKLDIPRKLTKEINETGKTVFANQYRQKFSHTGKGIIVAVIDSEIATNHSAFGNRVLHRSNYTKEPWGNPDSHATGVAGIIGSADDEFSGMAPEATIYNYKVLATKESLNSNDFEGALAIQQALEDGAQLVNCSWGAGPASDGTGREARACNRAWELGLTIVKSAGNRGPGSGTLTTPADAEGVIVVGATGKDGKKVEKYSSRGPLASGENRPHLVAPGGNMAGAGIFSCLIQGGFGDIGIGTSFAAPHVTGLLALILEANPSLSSDGQRDFLIKLCTSLNGFAVDDQGAGFTSLAGLL
jgi:serine protease AprX